MGLRLAESSIGIATTVNAFSRVYHDDYFRARPVVRKWIADEPPAEATTNELIRQVRRVLISWGAGKREAPRLSSEEDFAGAFRHIPLRRNRSLLNP